MKRKPNQKSLFGGCFFFGFVVVIAFVINAVVVVSLILFFSFIAISMIIYKGLEKQEPLLPS